MNQYELEYLNPAVLVDYPLNAKKHDEAQIDKLAKEIEAVGFRVPIVVDHLGVIVAGHCRKQAAIKAGLGSVPVHRLPADISPERIRAMRLFDNKIAESGMDEKLLQQELSELVSLDGFDFAWTGFAESEIVDISPSELDDEEENKDPESSGEQEADEDDTEGAAIPAVVPKRATPGSVWRLGRHLLVCGDSSDASLVHAHIGEREAHAIVTDPPYGLGEIRDLEGFVSDWLTGGSGDAFVGDAGFMGKWWDRTVPPPSLWKVWLSRARPGAHALVFSGTRTQDLMTLGLRIAGVEVRDQLAWLYGQGFPKSLDVSKAIDKEAGAEREVVGERRKLQSYGANEVYDSGPDKGGIQQLTAPATDAAREWEGWGTALKPSQEPITLARIPLSEDTVAKNVLKWGTGALNIDGCRVGDEPMGGYVRKGTGLTQPSTQRANGYRPEWDREDRPFEAKAAIGRFPANLILDEVLEPVLRLKDSLPCEVDALIREWFDDYGELPGLRQGNRDVSEQGKAKEVLRSRVLGACAQREHAGREALSLWEDPYGSDSGEAEEPAEEDGHGAPEVEGRVLHARLSDGSYRDSHAGRAGAVRVDGDDDGQAVRRGASARDGASHRTGAARGRGRASRQREEGGQPDREPGTPRRERAQERALGAIQGASEAPLLVRESDVPVLWARFFEPSGHEVRTRDCAAQALDAQSGILSKQGSPKKKDTGDSAAFGGGKPSTYFGDSGGASRFFYVAKASKADRNLGIEGALSWENVDQNLLDQTAKLSETLAATCEDTMPEHDVIAWSTSWSGKVITELFRKAIRSTTSTESVTTTASKTWNALLRLSTKESILGAIVTLLAHGLNPARLAAHTKELTSTSTDEKTESLLHASRALFDVLSKIKDAARTGSTHPTVKPLRLMRYLVRLVTPPSGVVLEPFCGSGTTLLACEKEGVACRAFEQDPHHCDIILARWEGLTGQKAELLTSP